MASATKNQKVAGQRRSLRAIQAKVKAMAETWAWEDEGNSTLLLELADQCEQAAKNLYGEESED
jgi:hypothetical protein